MGSFLVTTPIYYVNDLPHIGHIYTTIVADTVARYRRLAGDDVFFLTGTDEHGQKIERAARERGLEPLELAGQVVSRYHALWRQLGISHDDFIRTTEARHERGVQALIARLAASGDLYEDRHEGWYCTACEAFYTQKELTAEKRCPDHDEPAEWRSEENVYFRLSRYQDRLLEWYERNPEFIRPASRANEVRSFVAAGLRDLSVSRADLEWGIPFPGHSGQTVYVWLDALTNYVTALGFGCEADGTERLQRYWSDPAATRVHLVGKDILRFHAVYWPAFLMSAGLELPTTVWAHGWWLRDAKKVSKSVGNIVRPDELLRTFGADALRYFLLREMVFGQDAHFSDEAFIDRFNHDLANDLGNMVSRLVTLSRQAFDGRTPSVTCDSNPLIAAAREAVTEYRAAMEAFAFRKALSALWRLLAESSQYMVSREPWRMLKQEGPTPALGRVLWNSLEAVRIVGVGLLPFLPEIAPRLLAAIGVTETPGTLDAMTWGELPTDAELAEPRPLFPRIDREAYLGAANEGEPKSGDKEEESMISIEQFLQTELRVGTVTAAKAIPKSRKLLELTVDLGGATRTVVAGIAQEYAPEELVGRQVVVVANLESARLMGVESQGMVLAAVTEDDRAVLLQPESAVPDGSRVR